MPPVVERSSHLYTTRHTCYAVGARDGRAPDPQPRRNRRHHRRSGRRRARRSAPSPSAVCATGYFSKTLLRRTGKSTRRSCCGGADRLIALATGA